MQPYVLTPSAEDDLKDVARYTLKQWGKKQSLHYANLLETCFLEIADRTPHSRSFSERYPQIRVSRCELTTSFTFILKETGLALSQFCMNEWIKLPGLKTVWIDKTKPQGLMHLIVGIPYVFPTYGLESFMKICYAVGSSIFMYLKSCHSTR